LREENALFSGDHIMGWSTTVISPPDGNMGDYYRSLDKVKARGFATLWPTHVPPVTDANTFIDAYVAHRRAREVAILARLAAGDALIFDMVKVIYKDVDVRLHPAAARSVLAHMIYLVEAGSVAAEGPLELSTRYRLAA
jgi:glyoxylase-like metal-dependent hydrolase (beta-lactamase superfamily II)